MANGELFDKGEHVFICISYGLWKP